MLPPSSYLLNLRRFWIVLDQGKLSEYSNWKQRLDLHTEPIDLRMASVREARSTDRRFCFEIITPQYKRVYQAPSGDDMHSWILAINNALQDAVETRSYPTDAPYANTTPGTGKDRRHIGSILTGKSSSFAGPHNSHHPSSGQHRGGESSSTGLVHRHRTIGARPTYADMQPSKQEEDPKRLLHTLQQHDQGNKRCADCGTENRVQWASINLAIILCIECSGIHRSLGTHISKVRSLTLDTTAFTTDIVEALLQMGNRVSNMIWEGALNASERLTPHSNREQRLQFISRKYVDHAFVTPLSQQSQSHFTTPQELLAASVKTNDAQGAVYGLALGADPNFRDRSRNTHSVFLALAAAAAPMSAASSMPHATSIDHSSDTSQSPTAFAVAELLLQNGAAIPPELPAFPLSPLAMLYLERKKSGANETSVRELPLEHVEKPREKSGGMHKTLDSNALGGKLQRRVVSGIRLGTGKS